MQMCLRLLSGLALAVVPVSADTQIDWFSTEAATNVTSDGVTAMGTGFRFELGVFQTGFTPTSGNVSQWVQNWRPAQRTSYSTDLKKYADSYMVTTNVSPFTLNAPAYIWGFKGDPDAGEWILFRSSSWLWPAGGNGPPAFVQWDAKNATAIIGTISSTGSPALMKSGSVIDLPPPTTSYAQWVDDELSGETLVAADEDADSDGIKNAFEFVLGTSPKVSTPSPVVSSIVDDSGSQYLQLSVPRRIDRPATVTVQVSGDLGIWLSGSGNTVQVSSTNSLLVVRDLTPISPSDPKRFIRAQVTVP